MKRKLMGFTAAAVGLGAIVVAEPVLAQKSGGILRMYSVDSPASMSIHEEATVFAQRPMMGVFNNLVMFDQHVKQSSLDSLVPDLAESWSWNEDGTELTFPLHQGVKWHDGKPLTVRDVKCTWDLLTDKSSEKYQPAQGLVPEPQRGHDQRRLRGHLPPQAAAAGLSRAARFRKFADLSVPCLAT